MATATPTITNGVNVTQLGDTVDLIKQQPAIARFTFRAAGSLDLGAAAIASPQRGAGWLRRFGRWVLQFSFTADADAVDGRATGARC